MKNCLIVFAKEPQSGRVKTRLGHFLSDRQCLGLYKAFLRDTKAITRDINCSFKILAYDSSLGEPRYLKKVFPKFIFYNQKGKDLGERMHQAFEWAKNLGAQKIVMIGSDAPTLPVRYIKKAFIELNNSDVVLGPSYDGGYYLIGLKIPCQPLFKNVAWSSDKTLAMTLRNARSFKKRVRLLRKWRDIDDAISLKYLQKNLRQNKNQAFSTKKFLKNL